MATATLTLSPSTLHHHRHRFPIRISVSVSGNPSTTKPTTPSSSSKNLPLKKIPGDYGVPFVGPLRDRLDYFYFQGRDEFFKSRIRTHGSTVIRVNMPPGPFVAPDPRVIALLDGASFPVLFDNDLVEKKDLFTGTYAPSVDLTGGYRILSYLDTTEPNHAPLKKLLFYLLSSRRQAVIPEFRRTFGALFDRMESEIAKEGKADFGEANDRASFDFLARALLGRDPVDTKLGLDGPKLIVKWVLFQIGPLLTLGIPSYLEDLLLHSFRLPPALVRADYQRLADFFRDSSGDVLDEAERLGLSREEAVHNIVFAICFNSFGGMKILFPSIVKLVGRAGARLHGKLAEEIREAVKSNGGEVSMRAMEGMPLLKSAVYEALRIEPPVPMQYGRARRDMVVESHGAAYQVRAGEMLFGYQPMATRDPKLFERAEEFVAERFVGESGEKMLKHVVWSNGPETAAPTVENKQCAGKDFVVLVARMLLVELFLRYDSFEIEVGTSALGSSVKLTSLKRASF